MAAPIKDGFRWCGRGFMSVIWPSFALSGLINIFYGPVNVISVVSCIRVQLEVALHFPRPALIWFYFGRLNFLPAPTRHREGGLRARLVLEAARPWLFTAVALRIPGAAVPALGQLFGFLIQVHVLQELLKVWC